MWSIRFIFALCLLANVSSKLFEKKPPPPHRVNKNLLLNKHCSAALLPSFQNAQWNKARDALGLGKFDMGKAYFSISRKVKTFYAFSAGISLFNISGVLVPYLIIWKAGNDAIRGNLQHEEERVARHSTKSPHMHIFDSPAGVNHVSYMTELRSYFPKNTKGPIQPPPAFTFVRDPMSHFVSGLAEYHFRCTPKRNVTAQVIRQQIRDLLEFRALFRDADPCEKRNVYAVRHVYPMAGVLLDYGKDDFNLNFIGKLENFDQDWAKVNSMYKMNLTFDHRIGVHPTSQDPNHVRREFSAMMERALAPGEDEAYIRALCHLLLVDYVCFEYPLPPPCSDHVTNNT